MIGNKYPSHTVMDVRIHAVTMEEALRCAREMAASGEEHIIATANAEMVMIAQEDKELVYVLNHCSLVVPDVFFLYPAYLDKNEYLCFS